MKHVIIIQDARKDHVHAMVKDYARNLQQHVQRPAYLKVMIAVLKQYAVHLLIAVHVVQDIHVVKDSVFMCRITAFQILIVQAEAYAAIINA